MTDVTKLSVSLTKHGAHKLATLLRLYPADEVLDHLSGSVEGVNIELAQAKKNLSASAAGDVPALWDEARARGEQVIDGLVLIAIISSHHHIIEALIAGKRPLHGTGVIERGTLLGGKAYTNTAHIIEQLGYSVEHTAEAVTYDFSRLFTVPGLNDLALSLLDLKLAKAGWKPTDGDLVDALIGIRLHDAFSVSEDFFRRWLAVGESASLEVSPPVEDAEYFSDVDDDVPLSGFSFAPGHNPKKTGSVIATPRARSSKMTFLHNQMQTELFEELVAQFGKDAVGTERPSGVGQTRIDLVVKTDKFCWFYEIKTAKSVRACIREAIPQLLEYAMWHGGKPSCDRMIIVGPKKLTPQADAYLKTLRTTYGLELHYHQHPV
jgi:hypothetical protein